MASQKKCYVYAIEVDGIIRYIGKGSNRGVTSRFNDHLRSMRRLIRRAAEGVEQLLHDEYGIGRFLAHEYLDGSVIREVIIADGLSETAALKREKGEIEALPKSQLWNKSAYKSGRPAGFKHSSETKAKMSESRKKFLAEHPEVHKNMLESRVFGPETRDKMSASAKVIILKRRRDKKGKLIAG